MQLYFLCTGNSARSQMAEGFAKQYAPKDWQIKSAGIEQHGLNPRAVAVMQESNIDISMQISDLIDLAYLNSSDYVITLCGDARDKCPITPAAVKRRHWPLLDPARPYDSAAEELTMFRLTRDKIEQLVDDLIQNIK